jgi:glycosyltransferase involved in cell wall biosynthesis
MRIAIVLPPGGLFAADQPNSIETVIRTLAAEAGEDEVLKVFCDEGAQTHGDLPMHVILKGGDRHTQLVAALEAFAPDIIEFHQHTISAAKLAKHFPNALRLLYRHNDVKPPRNPFDRWRYARRHKAFDGLIFVSEASRNAFVAAYPAFADRAFAVRNPINADLWSASPEERERLILFAGRAIPEKGLDLLCEALPEVLNRHPQWRAVLYLGDWHKHVGWGGPHVKRMLARTDQVTTRPNAPLADVREDMKTAAIAVVPSVWAEPLGLAALEAHAAGAALVSSGRGGLREVSGPHAVYVEPLTAQTLTEAIEGLINDPKGRLDLARAGQAHVMQTHTPAARAAELSALRRRLLETRRAG